MIKIDERDEKLAWCGSTIECSTYNDYGGGDYTGFIWGGVDQVLDGLESESIDRALKYINSLCVSEPYELRSVLSNAIHVSVNFEKTKSDYIVGTEVNIHWEDWAFPFSIDTFKRWFISPERNSTPLGCKWYLTEDDTLSGDLMLRQTLGPEQTLAACFESSQIIVENAILAFLDSWNAKNVDKTTALYNFYFPDEVSTACEQYLVYFSQFLADLGLNAVTNLNHAGPASIFEVIPGDKKTALTDLHHALEVYLRLPGYDISKFGETSNIAHLQLSSQLDHLKSQLRLAEATIEAKNATIGTLSRPPQEANKKNSGQEENIFGGLVTIGSIKLGAAKINVGELIRKLRR